MDYIESVSPRHQTEEFSGWLRRLRDANAVARIVGRIRRMEVGNPGDARGVGRGIFEMRIDYGPGYRIYYVHRGAQIVILLCGGDNARNRRTSNGLRSWRRHGDAQGGTNDNAI
jgi:putative addiction module killer protein